MAIYLMDKTYRVEDKEGVKAYRCVVAGEKTGTCRNGFDHAPGFLGVTVHSQPAPGRGVTVRKLGIAECIAAGPIRYGEPVRMAKEGKVQGYSVGMNPNEGLHVNCIGFAETAAAEDGDVVEVFLCPHERQVLYVEAGSANAGD